MDDLEQKIKQKLLEGLVEHMQGKMGESLSSKYPSEKAMEVSVAAPDKEHLAEGLEHAHAMAASGKLGGEVGGESPEEHDEAHESDEDRLMELLGDDEDHEDKEDDEKSRF
ncbi:MAG: hypothetical protein NVSMB70_05430 [Chamaesiphon sp.]